MQNDIDRFLQTETTNGAELWSAADGAIGKGGVFSCLEAGIFLKEFGYTPEQGNKLADLAERIFANQQDQIRFRTFMTGTLFPCQTINATRALCLLGYAADPRLDRTIYHLLETQQSDGGWKCNSFKYGHGPETEYSNPGPSLFALDIFRHHPGHNDSAYLQKTVDFLLGHWLSREPWGPCHYGIGTQFLKIEYPMIRYNLLGFVYILSFYKAAVGDSRFHEALKALAGKVSGQTIPIENPPRLLKDYSFYTQKTADTLAFARYAEILHNIQD